MVLICVFFLPFSEQTIISLDTANGPARMNCDAVLCV